MKQRSIEPSVFSVDTGAARLLGGYCESSGQYHFPRQPVCPYTGADDVYDVELSGTGTVWGWTVVTAPPPGYEGAVPYGFGVVELTHERLRVITRLLIDDPAALEFGDAMQLRADVVGVDADGTEVVSWAFGKVEAS